MKFYRHPIPTSICIKIFSVAALLTALVNYKPSISFSPLPFPSTPLSNFDLRESIFNQTTFSLQLANLLGSSLTTNSNIVFSPISIHTALALVAAGSKGETLNQILAVLRSGSAAGLRALSSHISDIVLADGSPSGGPRLSFANGVWVDASLSPKSTFKEVLVSAYKAEIKAVDFRGKADEAIQEMNSWVQNITGGLINELPYGSVDFETKLVLSNALCFKGVWNKRFDASQTKNSEFYLLDGTTIQAPFMTSNEEQYLSAYDDFKVLRMPYKQGEEDKRQFSMYIFLPEARDGLSNMAEMLCSESGGFFSHHIPWEKVEVGEFKIPKFKISFGFEASNLLKTLGLVLPFGSNADLSEMVDSAQNLVVSAIHHKSFVEVNEEGTEAAAATATFLDNMPLDFVADHPFLFVIREDLTGLVLFIGHLLNPQTAV